MLIKLNPNGKEIKKAAFVFRQITTSFFWCEGWDLNPYGMPIRPSNVRVCQFRHHRTDTYKVYSTWRRLSRSFSEISKQKSIFFVKAVYEMLYRFGGAVYAELRRVYAQIVVRRNAPGFGSIKVVVIRALFIRLAD